MIKVSAIKCLFQDIFANIRKFYYRTNKTLIKSIYAKKSA